MNSSELSEVQEIVDRETAAWNEKSIHALLSVFHLDMVWVWPTNPRVHDPITWESPQGRFHYSRWSLLYTEWFSKFELIKNNRTTQKIVLTEQGDGAFAIVDIDTLWRSKTGEESHWLGRTCKTYVKTNVGWKMIAQVGVLDYAEQTK